MVPSSPTVKYLVSLGRPPPGFSAMANTISFISSYARLYGAGAVGAGGVETTGSPGNDFTSIS